MLGTTEIIIILIVAGLILFGKGEKIKELARTLGKFSSEFKKGKKEVEEKIEDIKKEIENHPNNPNISERHEYSERSDKFVA